MTESRVEKPWNWLRRQWRRGALAEAQARPDRVVEAECRIAAAKASMGTPGAEDHAVAERDRLRARLADVEYHLAFDKLYREASVAESRRLGPSGRAVRTRRLANPTAYYQELVGSDDPQLRDLGKYALRVLGRTPDVADSLRGLTTAAADGSTDRPTARAAA